MLSNDLALFRLLFFSYKYFLFNRIYNVNSEPFYGRILKESPQDSRKSALKTFLFGTLKTAFFCNA